MARFPIKFTTAKSLGGYLEIKTT